MRDARGWDAIVNGMCLLLLIVLSGCDSISLSNLLGPTIVTGAVLAKAFQSDTGLASEATSEYSPNQKSFHLVVTVADAPKDTQFKSIWTAVDIGGATPPNTKLEERELIVTGSGTFEFAITPKGGAWPPGKYRVDLYSNNTLARSLDFSVAGSIAARLATPQPTTVKCPPVTSPPAKPSGVITKIVTADSVDAFGNAMNQISLFKPTAKVYVVMSFKNAPSNLKLNVRWYAVDVGTAAACNTLLADDEHTASGTGQYAAYIEKKTPWPVGSYRAEIYLAGKLEQVVSFSVKDQ